MQNLERFKNATFKVLTSSGTGSCLYIHDQDIIVTNHHVIEGFKEVAIEDDRKNRMHAKVILTNPDLDIAVLKTETKLNIANTITLEPNLILSRQQQVYALGYPFGMPFTITSGIVSNPQQHRDGKYFVQTDAAINPGNSGGPLVTHDGKLAGINSSKFNNADNVGFAIPISVIKDVIDRVKENTSFDFSLQCSSCSGLSYEAQEYCANCGATLDKNVFEEVKLGEFSVFIEEALTQLDINPVLTRAGFEFWEFHQGSSLIRIFVMNKNYLYVTSPINNLPKKNLGGLYEYLVASDLGAFSLGIYQNQIFVSYRLHMSDLFKEETTKNSIKTKIKELAIKADELDDFFVEKYHCTISTHARKVG